MAAGMDDDPWEGGLAQLEERWAQWMVDNEPRGGWKQARLTNKPTGSTAAGGAQTICFKHFGSLWRRNEIQWDLYLERGHMTIDEAEGQLKTHPYVKGHTVKNKVQRDPDRLEGPEEQGP